MGGFDYAGRMAWFNYARVIRWCRYRGYQRCMYEACGKTFNDMTGTIFHYSRLNLRAYSQNTPIFTSLQEILIKALITCQQHSYLGA
ncbi:MAG: hypothetical protein LZ172_00705 [Thaumarchaeota archaeon]|jgi:hypothetical protein|nr:hypothetical protein [Candidatus Geocrenenecus arthurdayi]MCL7389608.1 hypothetical protein [Candidatus Geocrenenecus arthurdayi]MCL7402859.1 hypothetical protein [Candidatus Geocrenenecus arthurdayi]